MHSCYLIVNIIPFHPHPALYKILNTLLPKCEEHKDIKP